METEQLNFDLFDLKTYQHKQLFANTIYPWEALKNLESYLQKTPLGAIRGEVSPQAILVNPESISIGIGTVVEPGAYIKGPCIIGNYCSVRHGAYIRGGVITGDHCVIGHCTEIKNSILLQSSQVAHFGYVGDSIIGNQVNLGAGVRLANLLFNKKSIVIEIEKEKIDTKRKKLGAMIGDQSQIGCNSVTNPGTILFKNARVYPCINVGGVVARGSSIKSSVETVAFSKKTYAHS